MNLLSCQGQVREMERRRGGETERRRDGVERWRDGEKERRRDGEHLTTSQVRSALESPCKGWNRLQSKTGRPHSVLGRILSELNPPTFPPASGVWGQREAGWGNSSLSVRLALSIWLDCENVSPPSLINGNSTILIHGPLWSI